MMNGKPLMIDGFCGLGGASAGFLAEGWECVGLDNELHDYGDGRYPGHLILCDILQVHGSQFKDAEFLWFSPPCQEYSYRAMPWKMAKAQTPEVLPDWWKLAEPPKDRSKFDSTKHMNPWQLLEWTTWRREHPLPPCDNSLFDACFRIQREASEAAGRHIPMIVENVRGAQRWVGRSVYNYGSFHLWGDVPALMPTTRRPLKGGDRNKNRAEGHAWTASFADTLAVEGFKTGGMNWSDQTKRGQDFTRIAAMQGQKTTALTQMRDGHGRTRHLTNQAEHDGLKPPRQQWPTPMGGPRSEAAAGCGH